VDQLPSNEKVSHRINHDFPVTVVKNHVFFGIDWVKEHTKSQSVEGQRTLASQSTSVSIKKTDAHTAFSVYIIIQTPSYISKSTETRVDIIKQPMNRLSWCISLSAVSPNIFRLLKEFLGITCLSSYTVIHKTPRIISYRQGDPFLLLRTQSDARQQIQTHTARPLHINYSCTGCV
jgi:hypothetical protein